MRWECVWVMFGLAAMGGAQELPSRDVWGALPDGSLLIQAEDFDGPWRKQTNIVGYTGTSFRCANHFGSIVKTKLTYDANMEHAGRYQI